MLSRVFVLPLTVRKQGLTEPLQRIPGRPNTRPGSQPLERSATSYGRDERTARVLIWSGFVASAVGAAWRGLIALAVGVWALLWSRGELLNLGTVSDRWLAEHRAHENELNKY